MPAGSSIAVAAAVISAGAAISAAIISALTARSVAAQARQQKLAEFRKEWIEDLRVHLAEFYSVCYIIRVINSQYEQAKDKEAKTPIETEMKSKYERLRYLHNYIALMLNPAEDLHQQMERKMDEMTRTLRRRKDKTAATASEAAPKSAPELPKFSVLARKILKAEWDRLKTET